MHMTEIYDKCMYKTVFTAILNVSCVYAKQIRNKKNKMEKMCEENRGRGGMLNLQHERCYDYQGRRLVCGLS
jgi:hypothetical protein